MSAFELVFSLFGLLLGLSLAEVLGGFARTLKVRRAVRIGWLSPLLGLFLMLHLTSFWITAWQWRDNIPANFTALVVGLLLTGIYYLGAALVFPNRPEDWPDLDDYFSLNKRPVLGCAVAADGISWVAQRALSTDRLAAGDYLFLAIGELVLILAIVVRGKWPNTALLIVILLPFAMRIAKGA